MPIHKGEIVKNIVQQCGMKITTISTKLKISRNTLYNKFDDPDLSDEFILRLSDVIRYDFSSCFPHLSENSITPEVNDEPVTYVDRLTEKLMNQERKYINLLEKHNGLLTLLAKTIRASNSSIIEEELDSFITNNNN